MSGLAKADGGKFNFKVKMVRTDLACREYLFGMGFGMSGNLPEADSSFIYQNSDYISKLYFINNYSGGILSQNNSDNSDKTEEIPDKYKYFIRADKPSDAELVGAFKKNLVMLANREKIGHNVFYNGLAGYEKPKLQTQDNSAANELNFEEFPDFADFAEFVESVLLGDDFFNEFQDNFYPEDNSDGETEEDNGGDNDDDKEDKNDIFSENPPINQKNDDEIKEILNLNNVYNSDLYKTSKMSYDFNIQGEINLTKNGLITVKYAEVETTGFNTYTQFVFNPENRDILTLRKKFFFDDWFMLEKGKRISVEKRGHYSGEIMTTATKELVNNITPDGGEMKISYIIETDGVPTEEISYHIYAEAVV